jgi:sugar lactone lactonase YvrE
MTHQSEFGVRVGRRLRRASATRGLRLGSVVAVLAATFAAAASGSGSATTFDRTWGKDVGGPGVGLCTAAASCLAGVQGGLGGEFNSPSSVATDATGNVYVADTFNERVEKFDASGAFLLAWGKDVGGAGVGLCTTAASCQAGSTGGQGGEFAVNGPDGVATDATGNVYVTEFYGNRIQKFTSSGGFVRAWGKNVGGVGVGVCTVAAACQAGSSGGLGGELFGPEGVATDAAGNVYVADSVNRRIQKFDASGAFLRAWGKDVGGAGVGLCTVAGSCHAGNPGGLGDEFSNPFGVGTDTAGAVYVTDANLFRVQKFDTSGAFLRAWGKNVGGAGVGLCTVAASCQPGTSGAQGGEFNANGPDGVATDPAGNVYVANAAAGGRLQQFDSSGAFLQAWGKDVGGTGVAICTVPADCQVGSAGGLGGEFASPAGVATDATGALYVADYANRRIQKFAAPAPLRTLTVTITGTGTVTGPGIDCGAGHTDCSESVASGTTIPLTATPAAGMRFAGFTGGGCGATSPCTVTMNADQTVAAAFVALAGPPSVTLITPADGADYPVGAAANASYTCAAGANGGALKPGAAGCSGPVAAGSPIDTTVAGTRTFAVTATDTDGQTATKAVRYTVTSSPPPTVFAALPTAAACTAGRLILTDVYPRAGRTRVLGVAPASARGKRVTIVSTWNGKGVATATVAADLSFTASLPLPPPSLRATNKARYLARLGATKSAALKFSRRMYTTAITAAGATLTFRGTVTRPLTTPPSHVTIRAASSCATIGRGVVVATVTPTRSGTFTATFTLPPALQARTVFLRAQTTVRRTARSTTTSPTFTLVRGITPLPAR